MKRNHHWSSDNRHWKLAGGGFKERGIAEKGERWAVVDAMMVANAVSGNNLD